MKIFDRSQSPAALDASGGAADHTAPSDSTARMARHEPSSPASAAALPATGLAGYLPGLLLVGAITALAYGLRLLPGLGVLSPMILAILIGFLLRSAVSVPSRARPGVQFSMRQLLRLAVVMLGFQITFEQVFEVGGRGMAIIATTLAATFLFTCWLGARLGVERRLVQLIATGTSICGASAVVAANSVAKGSEEDVTYAIACVTVFGTLAMFALPPLASALALDSHAYGLWTGASIHEIAQVIGAAFQGGQVAGEIGTISKLSRVILLAPVVLALGWYVQRAAARERGGDAAASAKVPVPWFVVGFVALVCLGSAFALPVELKRALMTLSTLLLTMALAAMGLETDARKLRARGLRPFALGAAASLFIAGLSLVLIKLFA